MQSGFAMQCPKRISPIVVNFDGPANMTESTCELRKHDLPGASRERGFMIDCDEQHIENMIVQFARTEIGAEM
jgi:hypothetical protein